LAGYIRVTILEPSPVEDSQIVKYWSWRNSSKFILPR